MPVYNAEKYLAQAVDSVLNQSFGGFEFIIIDDGSRDKTPEILSDYEKIEKRIKIKTNNENLGVVKCLNIGLELARGEYIARIDADDIWKPEKLEKQINHMSENEDIYLLATAKINIDNAGDIRWGDKYPRLFSYKQIRNNLLKRNIICHSSVVFRKDIINSIGKYNESYKNSEDYEYWIRIAARYKVEILEQPLVYYRISKETISYNRLKEQRYFAIKAKLAGIRVLEYKWHSVFYILEDLPYLIIPGFVYRIRKKYRRL